MSVVNISAPKSGSTTVVLEPLVEQIWTVWLGTVIMGAGSVNLAWCMETR